MKNTHLSWAITSALAGGLVLAAGTALSILSYNHAHAAPYSMASHFVSELGWVKVTRMAWLFNWSLVASTLAFMPLMLALGRHVRTRLGTVAAGTGLCSMAAGAGVGILPLDVLGPHLLAALLFFVTWSVAVALFTLAFCPRWNPRPSRPMVAAGILCCLISLVFLALPKESLLPALREMEAGTFRRPTLWWLAVLEWCMVLSACLWASLATLELWRQSQRQPKRPTSESRRQASAAGCKPPRRCAAKGVTDTPCRLRLSL